LRMIWSGECRRFFMCAVLLAPFWSIGLAQRAAQFTGTRSRPPPATTPSIGRATPWAGDLSGLGYAEAFRTRLGVPLGQLIPALLADQREPIPPERWAMERRVAGQELIALMKEYRAAQVAGF